MLFAAKNAAKNTNLLLMFCFNVCINALYDASFAFINNNMRSFLFLFINESRETINSDKQKCKFFNTELRDRISLVNLILKLPIALNIIN